MKFCVILPYHDADCLVLLLCCFQPELASKAFHIVKEEFRLIKDPANKFTTEQFNTLVALYAKKALEFTVIQYLEGMYF